MEKSDCIGCEDNFYNGNNNLGVLSCWKLHGYGNRVKRRYRIHYNTPTNIHEAYQEVRCPSCYRQKGYAYMDKIPHYAQTREQREKEAQGVC